MNIAFEVIPERVKVSCLWRAADAARDWRASHVLSLLDPELPDANVPAIADASHRVVRMRDQENPTATQHFPDLVLEVFEAMRRRPSMLRAAFSCIAMPASAARRPLPMV